MTAFGASLQHCTERFLLCALTCDDLQSLNAYRTILVIAVIHALALASVLICRKHLCSMACTVIRFLAKLEQCSVALQQLGMSMQNASNTSANF